jgi:glycopeptide antibiotics resistance protein
LEIANLEIIIDDKAIPTWPIGILMLIVVLVILWRQKKKWSYLFFFSIFWVYAMSSLDKVFFPIQINGEYVDALRQIPLTSQINLVPIYVGPYGLNFMGMIYNVLLTVPFGFGLNFISWVKTAHFLWLAAGIGLGIETIQLVISLILQYPYRVVDINDAILNAAGALIGYLLFKVFSWLYVGVTKRFEIEHSGLSSYIHEVVARK